MTSSPPAVVIPAKAGIQLWAVVFSGLIFLGTASEACADSILARPVPPVLIEQVTCMVKALKTAPKIDHIKSEVARIGGMPQASIEYRDNSKAGEGASLMFGTQGLEPPYEFTVVLSGLYGDGMRGPKEHGVQRVEDLWKKRCRVFAITLFI